MSPHQESRIIKICKDHNWEITAAQLEVIKECAEDHQLCVTLDAFHNQPTQFYSPSKKAKEIALEAANKNGQCQNCRVLVEEAELIYQWLIKKDHP